MIDLRSFVIGLASGAVLALAGVGATALRALDRAIRPRVDPAHAEQDTW